MLMKTVDIEPNHAEMYRQIYLFSENIVCLYKFKHFTPQAAI